MLLDLPSTLLSGFFPHLTRLKQISNYSELAFNEMIAPKESTTQCVIGPPVYTTHGKFEFNLSALTSSDDPNNAMVLKLQPMQHAEVGSDNDVLQTLESKTTLDQGQARALYEMLSRKLAFTQGPPGTGNFMELI